MTLKIQVLLSPGCPHAAPAVSLAHDVAANMSSDAQVQEVQIRTVEEAQAHGFAGSPTIRVNDVDIEPGSGSPGVLACRVYQGGSGVPAQWKLEAAVLRALAPKHILFLCVANSARSQMAEGIARSLAPKGVEVSSAGSAPTQVRPQAIEVLREIGIDISSHVSKSVEDIEPSSVQAVVTLCAEEVCPVFLGRAWRIHWGLSDPAFAKGSDEDVMRAFRGVRDELSERLACLFEGWI